jgi:DeoR family fructose operon transcriptional repressor
LIQEKKKIVVPELCEYFGVSPSTVRNDLRELTESNLITRTHGGAIANSKSGFEPLPEEKQSRMHAQKRQIAKRAAEMVDDGDIIAISTGTTTFEFAKALSEKKTSPPW